MTRSPIAWLLTLLVLTPAAAVGEALTDAQAIVDGANLAAYYAGADGRSEARMIIRDAQGREQMRQFTILRRDRSDGGDQDFLVVFSRPSDVRGTVFLVAKHLDRDDDRWLYLPGLDLVKRIAAGDKRTSFVGSNYFYEDVSGRNPNDDVHELLETTAETYHLRHTPKNPGSVEFARFETRVDRQTLLPMRIEYFDERGEIYRRVEVLAVEDIGGHPTVTRSRVQDLEAGSETTLEFRFIAYDLGIEAEVFSERSLRNPPREWLQRPE